MYRAEKAVDTQLCADALQLAAVGKLDRLFLYTNDYDFAPLCRALRNLGRNVNLFRLQPLNINRELASLSRTACGHWIFTWNALRIECDPQSVIKTVEAYDLRSADPHEGAPYRDSEAGSPGKPARKAGVADGETFVVEMPVDPEAVRNARAESDVILGEIIKKAVSLETALHDRPGEIVSGTISVTFETDANRNVRRRTRVTKLDIKLPDGRSETQTVTDTLEWRPISRHD